MRDNNKIYVADDEAEIRKLIQSFLQEEGYEVTAFSTGDALLAAFEESPAALVILDIMMPGTDGLSICSSIRKKSDVPIILLTARGTDADYITGFTLGCDDYFTKPFSPVKLTMRVKAMLRRRAAEQTGGDKKELSFGDVRLYPLQKTAYCREKEIRLTNTEYSLMTHLLENQERAVSREELLNAVWGYDNYVETRATDDIVKRLRKKLMSLRSSMVIETVWGFGFKLVREDGHAEK